MQLEPVKSELCRWQYLFPLGLTELYRFPDGTTEKTTYSARTLQQFVDGFARVDQWMRAQGMPTQPRPVSINHGFIHGETEAEKRRVGNVWALRLHMDDDGTPKGLWALTEWTREGLQMIGDGTYNLLSPTNVKTMHTETGSVLKGQFLVEVGLVAEPFLMQIGTANDFVDVHTWPIPDIGRPIESQNQPARAARSFAHINPTGSVLTRSALAFEQNKEIDMTNKILVKTRMAPEGTEPESPEVEIDLDDLIAKMGGGGEKLRQMVDSMIAERGYMKREDVVAMMEEERQRAVTTPTITDTGSAPPEPKTMAAPPAAAPAATPPPATEPTVDPASRNKQNTSIDDEWEAKIRSDNRKALWTQAEGLVKEGRLLTRNAKRYVEAAEAGEPTDGLLLDAAATSRAQGAVVPGVNVDPAPKTRSVSLTAERSKLYAEGLRDPSEIQTRMKKFQYESEKAGLEVTE